MEILEIKNKLKKSQPYLIQRDLLPKMFFKEDRVKRETLHNELVSKETEYWIFFYSFIRKLPDVSIGVRLNYTPQNIHKKTLSIIKNNLFLIEDFLKNS